MSAAQGINKVLDSFPKSHNEIFIATAATLLGTMFVFDVSSISAFKSHDAYWEFINYPSSTEQGTITAAVSARCVLGSLRSGFVSEPLGRRKSLVEVTRQQGLVHIRDLLHVIQD